MNQTTAPATPTTVTFWEVADESEGYSNINEVLADMFRQKFGANYHAVRFTNEADAQEFARQAVRRVNPNSIRPMYTQALWTQGVQSTPRKDAFMEAHHTEVRSIGAPMYREVNGFITASFAYEIQFAFSYTDLKSITVNGEVYQRSEKVMVHSPWIESNRRHTVALRVSQQSFSVYA
jgi:hypothetical protein